MIAYFLTSLLLIGQPTSQITAHDDHFLAFQNGLTRSEDCLGHAPSQDMAGMDGVRWACWVGSISEVDRAALAASGRLRDEGWTAAEPLHFMAGFWREVSPGQCEQVVIALVPAENSDTQKAAMMLALFPPGECRGLSQ